MPSDVRGGYLLVVEDHGAMRDQLVQLLEAGLPGSAAYGVESGEAALQFVAQGMPAAAVIDVGLPGMDGIATTRALRTHSTDLPVIVISMRASALHEQEARAAGAAMFITKSGVAERLVPALRALLG